MLGLLTSVSAAASPIEMNFKGIGTRTGDEAQVRVKFDTADFSVNAEEYQECVTPVDGSGGQDGSWDCAQYETRFRHFVRATAQFDLTITRRSDHRVFHATITQPIAAESYNSPSKGQMAISELRPKLSVRFSFADYSQGAIDAFPVLGKISFTKQNEKWQIDSFDPRAENEFVGKGDVTNFSPSWKEVESFKLQLDGFR
jgi:hypothetical protein